MNSLNSYKQQQTNPNEID